MENCQKVAIPRAVRFGEFWQRVLRSSSIAEIAVNFSMLARSSNALGRKRRSTKFIKDDGARYIIVILKKGAPRLSHVGKLSENK